MFSLNLFREYRVRGFADMRAWWLPLLFVPIAAGCLVPSWLHAGEPSTDVPALASTAAAGTATTAEKAAGSPESSAVAADGSEMPAASKSQTPAKRRGSAARLPAYYGLVVDDQQRAAIYEIRARVAAQLQPLMQQIDIIRQAEQAEMQAVLTPEQLHRIEALRAQREKASE